MTTTDGLSTRFPDAVSTAGDPDWDAARATFNLLIDQRPVAVARPRDAEEAAALVRAAGEAGMRVAPQGSGHNAGPLGALQSTLVVKTERMGAVEIDAVNETARVEAGARWWDVLPKAAEHGLSALHGSSPEVNVVGYSLGGGIGWQARKRGLQASSITAVEVVTADGQLRRVDADNDPDLFWALRGAGGNFGLVTAIEFRLYPLTQVYAGSFFFPYERSGEVFQAWHEWTATVPEEVTSAVRMLQFPDFEEIPDVVRGQSFAVVGATCLAEEPEGAELTAPLRDLGPGMDTFAMVPPDALGALHMDPEDPVPYLSVHSLAGEMPAQAFADVVAAAGPGTESILAAVEFRHLGGALRRPPAEGGALAAIDCEYLTFAVAPVMAPEMGEVGKSQLARVAEALEPYDVGRYPNFTEDPHDLAAMFPADVLERLRAIRAEYDPERLFHANHPV